MTLVTHKKVTVVLLNKADVFPDLSGLLFLFYLETRSTSDC